MYENTYMYTIHTYLPQTVHNFFNNYSLIFPKSLVPPQQFVVYN